MTSPEIAARVSDLKPRFLDGLAPSELGVVLEAATARRFSAHSSITYEGHSADKLFLILEGLARTYTTTQRGDKILLIWIPAGEVSGGRAMLRTPANYLMSTEVVTDSCVLMWTRSSILALAKQYPRLLENALQIASDYLTVYRDLHIAASYDSASQRVARVLDRLMKGMGQRVSVGTEVIVNNEELANEANVTIFTVSRLLSGWQRKGLLVKGRGRVVIRSPEALLRDAGRILPIGESRGSVEKIAQEQRWNEMEGASL
jgi:CRP/FNR family transcriptional regulator, nitrogen oxide reductase regulator